MKAKLKIIALMLGAAGLATSRIAPRRQDKVKIGFVTDMSSLYADIEGKGGATAIQMAIDDFGGKVLGKPIELLTADHQNKADIAASKAREWIDTAGADDDLRRHQLRHRAGHGQGGAGEEARRTSPTAPATSALTNEQCSPYTVHYAYDTVALAKGTGGAVVDTRRQELVLPDRRLRLRPRARSRHQPRSSRPRAARWSARCAHRSTRRTSRPSCCRRRTPRRRCWAWPTRAATPSTRSRRPRSSASTRP